MRASEAVAALSAAASTEHARQEAVPGTINNQLAETVASNKEREEHIDAAEECIQGWCRKQAARPFLSPAVASNGARLTPYFPLRFFSVAGFRWNTESNACEPIIPVIGFSVDKFHNQA